MTPATYEASPVVRWMATIMLWALFANMVWLFTAPMSFEFLLTILTALLMAAPFVGLSMAIVWATRLIWQ